MLTDGGEPETDQEDILHESKKEWVKAMQEKVRSLLENHTYDLVKLPQGKKALGNKWVYRLKTENNGSQLKYKARLLVKAFNQNKGIDFEEIFAPMVKMSSIRVALGLTAHLNLEVEQLDVKTAFLHGDLEEEIYMQQCEELALQYPTRPGVRTVFGTRSSLLRILIQFFFSIKHISNAHL